MTRKKDKANLPGISITTKTQRTGKGKNQKGKKKTKKKKKKKKKKEEKNIRRYGCNWTQWKKESPNETLRASLKHPTSPSAQT
jgi:hypothetical protein